jgi:putative ABC transport system permease protein
MPDTLGAKLRDLPGIAAVEPFRAAPIRLGDRTVYLQGIALDERLAHGGLPMVEGTLEDAASALRAGTGVLLSDNLAYRLGVHRGDDLSVPTMTGLRRFRIEGVYIDYLGSLDLGAIAVAYPELARTFGDHDVNIFRLWTAPGTSPTAARQAVLERLGAGNGYYVLTAGQFLDAIRAQVRGFFLATWALQVIAAVVGVIGVVNAQLATVLDRSTEISVLPYDRLWHARLDPSVLIECGVHLDDWGAERCCDRGYGEHADRHRGAAARSPAGASRSRFRLPRSWRASRPRRSSLPSLAGYLPALPHA